MGHATPMHYVTSKYNRYKLVVRIETSKDPAFGQQHLMQREGGEKPKSNFFFSSTSSRGRAGLSWHENHLSFQKNDVFFRVRMALLLLNRLI